MSKNEEKDLFTSKAEYHQGLEKWDEEHPPKDVEIIKEDEMVSGRPLKEGECGIAESEGIKYRILRADGDFYLDTIGGGESITNYIVSFSGKVEIQEQDGGYQVFDEGRSFNDLPEALRKAVLEFSTKTIRKRLEKLA